MECEIMGNKYVKSFVEIGDCELNVSEVLKDFNEEWIISKWKHQFTILNKQGLKVNIDNFTAHGLIGSLNLKEYKSEVFRSGSTYKL